MSCTSALKRCTRLPSILSSTVSSPSPLTTSLLLAHRLTIATTTSSIPITPPHRRQQSSISSSSSSSDAKISPIVDQISQLTLLETADLISTLKTRLNIPDAPLAFAGGAAPGAGGAAAAAAAPEEDEAPAAQEKTLFTLKLSSFEATAKPKIIKEIKGMLGLSLVDSKKFVEAAPKVMREGVPKEEAEKIVASLKALGGVVVME
ncbi:MAG: hypothetical protein M1825_005080 [Sarcosagium campestre]|nr:MAG: hypothetical protein M1825_005080 [Sarcosagium campestre]